MNHEYIISMSLFSGLSLFSTTILPPKMVFVKLFAHDSHLHPSLVHCTTAGLLALRFGGCHFSGRCRCSGRCRFSGRCCRCCRRCCTWVQTTYSTQGIPKRFQIHPASDTIWYLKTLHDIYETSVDHGIHYRTLGPLFGEHLDSSRFVGTICKYDYSTQPTWCEIGQPSTVSSAGHP